MAKNIDDLLAKAEAYKSIPHTGAGVAHIGSILNDLKGAVQSGDLPLTDFLSYSEPLAMKAKNITETVARQGSAAANSVNPSWMAIVNGGFIEGVNGKYTALLPFTKREYAKLPDNVLPTQEDISQGLFDNTLAPIPRLRQAPVTPTTPTAPTTPTDGSLPSAPITATNPMGGTVGGTTAGGRDEGQLIAEAELQKQLSAEAAAAREQKRKSYLTDLGNLLDQSNQQAFNLARPDIYEDLNRRGLLQSTETGRALASKQAELQQARDLELSKQALLYSDEATNDLKSIQANYLADRENAISRRYSLEDYNRQIQAGKELGEYAASISPKPESGKSARDQQIWSGALMATNTAAQAGTKAATKGAA